jgi:hypothetical protein
MIAVQITRTNLEGKASLGWWIACSSAHGLGETSEPAARFHWLAARSPKTPTKSHRKTHKSKKKPRH